MKRIHINLLFQECRKYYYSNTHTAFATINWKRKWTHKKTYDQCLSSINNIFISPVACTILALNSWKYYSGQQGLTAQHSRKIAHSSSYSWTMHTNENKWNMLLPPYVNSLSKGGILTLIEWCLLRQTFRGWCWALLSRVIVPTV